MTPAAAVLVLLVWLALQAPIRVALHHLHPTTTPEEGNHA